MSIHHDKTPETSHYLGIDFGAADIGLALADTETRMAFAYGKYKNDKDILQKIANLTEEKNIKKIIIGIPKYINKENIEYAGEKLGRTLGKKLGIGVEYQNEMFTTKMAQANLIEKGEKGVKKHDDEEAARIILQEWLDNN
jgi:putative transcription antitermination factor YqgF